MVQGDGGQVERVALLAEVIQHDHIIDETGGLHGVHASRLSAAAARPYHTALGKSVYRGPIRKAAALFHAIVCDHVFVDGNKRTATAVTVLFLMVTPGYRKLGVNKLPTPLQVKLLGQVALEAAEGTLSVEDVEYWLRRIF